MAKDNHFNILNIMVLVIALIGLLFLAGLELKSGTFYLLLTFVGIVFLLICIYAKFVAKDDFWLEVPIYSSMPRGVLMFFVGIISFVAVVSASKIGGMNFYNPFVMAPLSSFGNPLSFGGQNFSALASATSPIGMFFVIVIVAAVIEEFVLGFCFVAMGSLIGSGLRKLLGIHFSESVNRYWDFIIAMIFSLSLFAMLHIFNGTYNTESGMNIDLFVFAAVFRLVMNILIYQLGNFGILFSTGFHGANNSAYLGATIVYSALNSFPVGIMIVIVFFILAFYAVINIKPVIQEGKFVANDFLTWD